MIRIKYKRPELKDMLENLIGGNFFLFANDVVARTLSSIGESTRLMNNMVLIVYPHTEGDMGTAIKQQGKGIMTLEVQDTPEELEKTLIHETIHLVKPWEDSKVEEKTQEIYKSYNPQGITI